MPVVASPRQSATPAPPSPSIARLGAKYLPRPPNSFCNGPMTGSLLPIPLVHAEASQTVIPSFNTPRSRSASLYSPSMESLRTQNAKTNINPFSRVKISYGRECNAATSANKVTFPNDHEQFAAPDDSFQNQSNGVSHSSGPFGDRLHVIAPSLEKINNELVSHPNMDQHRRDTVKWHAGIWDVQAYLNEVCIESFNASSPISCSCIATNLSIHRTA